MARVSGKKSRSEFNAEQYRQSWRAQRRESFVAQREAVRNARPTMLLGPRTDILTVLAVCGPVRMVALHELFGEGRVGQVRRGVDDLCISWKLPGADRRGQRGAAFALDPLHPLYKEANEVLLELAKAFPFRAVQDMTEGEKIIPTGARLHNLEKIVGYDNSLRVLSALEQLGGSVKLSLLMASVPGMRSAVVEATVRILTRNGILEKRGPELSFAARTWTESYRRLLRAYLVRRPELATDISAAAATKKIYTTLRQTNTIFGRDVVTRVLETLATDGPLPFAEVQVRSQMVNVLEGIRALEADGVLLRQAVRGPRGQRMLLGFNANHPLHRELIALHASVAGGTPSQKTPLAGPVKKIDIYRLFTSPVFAHILIALHKAINGEIDPASVCRMYPLHDEHNIMAILRRWADEEGLVLYRHFGNLVLYRLNPRYPHLWELRALLEAICSLDSLYQIRAELEPAQYLSTRQRTAHAKIGPGRERPAR